MWLFYKMNIWAGPSSLNFPGHIVTGSLRRPTSQCVCCLLTSCEHRLQAPRVESPQTTLAFLTLVIFTHPSHFSCLHMAFLPESFSDLFKIKWRITLSTLAAFSNPWLGTWKWRDRWEENCKGGLSLDQGFALSTKSDMRPVFVQPMSLEYCFYLSKWLKNQIIFYEM